MTARDEAMRAAERGWLVFPLHCPRAETCSCNKVRCTSVGKHPRTENGLDGATTDAHVIENWFRKWPDANFGIVTGKTTDLVVVDIDADKDGFASLATLEREFGPLPDTATVSTGGGGEHRYFKYPPVHALGNKTRLHGLSGIDIRANRGYVVGPASLHKSGNKYQWSTANRSTAILPTWLIELIEGVVKKQPLSVSGASVHDYGSRIHRAKAYLEKLPAAVSGHGGHDQTWKAALAVVVGFDLPVEVAFALLQDYNRRCDPPWAEQDLWHKLTDAATKSKINRGYLLQDSLAPSVASIDNEPRTDTGNAEQLARRYGHDLRWCPELRTWFAWDGKRWAPGAYHEAQRKAKETLRVMRAEAETLPDDIRKAAIKFALACESKERRNAMVELATHESRLGIKADALDANPWLFNVHNGTLDLTTGDCRSHQREDFITKMTSVSFDPEALSPTWDRFLESIMRGNHELISFLQRAVGYALTGKVNEQCLIFCLGTGANGKTTLLETLLALVGDYGRSAAPDLLLAKKGEAHPTEQADLFGARLVVAQEVEEGRRLAEVMVKRLTGGDRVKARFIRQDFFEFNPTHKFWLGANHKPLVASTDYAIWRRILLVPFEVTFAENERDRDLPNKLRAELSGILNWALRGCLDWQRNGLKPPREVLDATKQYRDEMDIVGDFIADECILDPAAKISTKDIFVRFVEWCGEWGERPLSQTLLGSALALRSELSKTKVRGRYVWHGITLRDGDGGDSSEPFPNSLTPKKSSEEISKTVSDAPPTPPALGPNGVKDVGVDV